MVIFDTIYFRVIYRLLKIINNVWCFLTPYSLTWNIGRKKLTRVVLWVHHLIFLRSMLYNLLIVKLFPSKCYFLNICIAKCFFYYYFIVSWCSEYSMPCFLGLKVRAAIWWALSQEMRSFSRNHLSAKTIRKGLKPNGLSDRLQIKLASASLKGRAQIEELLKGCSWTDLESGIA